MSKGYLDETSSYLRQWQCTNHYRRRHILLAAEGWIFFSLALVDMLSHILPIARNSMQVFRILDIAVGESITDRLKTRR